MTTTKLKTSKTSPSDRVRAYDILPKVYDLLGTNVENDDVSYRGIGIVLGIPEGAMNAILTDYEVAGFLQRRTTQRPPKDPSYRGGGGKMSHYKLLGPLSEAQAKLRAMYDAVPARDWRDHRKPRPAAEPAPPVRAATPAPSVRSAATVLATRETEQTRAISGGDPDSPFAVLAAERKNDAEALMEAARQYRDRSKLLADKLAELEANGIHVTLADTNMDQDDRLEAIGLVLDHYDQLVRANTRLTAELNAARDQIKALDRDARDSRALREQNRRLISEQVAREQRAISGS